MSPSGVLGSLVEGLTRRGNKSFRPMLLLSGRVGPVISQQTADSTPIS